jgi:hypothetical protein
MSLVSKMVSIWSSYSSGGGSTESPALEALDPTPLHERTLASGVRGMTVRAHLQYERFSYRARREFVATCVAAHVGLLQFGVLALHSVSSPHTDASQRSGRRRADDAPTRPSSLPPQVERARRSLHSARRPRQRYEIPRWRIVQGGRSRHAHRRRTSSSARSSRATRRACEDPKLRTPHLRNWERCAVVTDKGGSPMRIRVFRVVMPGEVNFPAGEFEDALAWAAAQGS